MLKAKVVERACLLLLSKEGRTSSKVKRILSEHEKVATLTHVDIMRPETISLLLFLLI